MQQVSSFWRTCTKLQGVFEILLFEVYFWLTTLCSSQYVPADGDNSDDDVVQFIDIDAMDSHLTDSDWLYYLVLIGYWWTMDRILLY